MRFDSIKQVLKKHRETGGGGGGGGGSSGSDAVAVVQLRDEWRGDGF